jgi:hypothetical protein
MSRADLSIYGSSFPPEISHIQHFSSCVHDLTRKLASRPDSRTIEDKDPWHDGKQRANTAQQATRWAIPELVVHLRGDEGKDTT